MLVNSIQIPNPLLVTGTAAFLAHQHSLINGVMLTKILRTPVGGGAAYAQKRTLLRFQFEDLTISDMYQMETAWLSLTMDYCVVQLTGLGINLTSYPGGATVLDAVYATAAPNAVNAFELYQGTALGINGLWEGPYLGKTTWALLTGDMRYATGG